MKEWKRLCEEKRLKAERLREKRLEAEREEKRLEVERELELKRIEAEKKKAAMELERAKIKFESKKGERENRSDVAEKIRINVRIAQSPELPAFVNGKDNLDYYLLRFERYAAVARWGENSWATQLSPLLSGRG